MNWLHRKVWENNLRNLYFSAENRDIFTMVKLQEFLEFTKVNEMWVKNWKIIEWARKNILYLLTSKRHLKLHWPSFFSKNWFGWKYIWRIATLIGISVPVVWNSKPTRSRSLVIKPLLCCSIIFAITFHRSLIFLFQWR